MRGPRKITPGLRCKPYLAGKRAPCAANTGEPAHTLSWSAANLPGAAIACRFGSNGVSVEPRLCRAGRHLGGARLLCGIPCSLRTRRVRWKRIPEQAVLAHGRMGQGHPLEEESAESKDKVDAVAGFHCQEMHPLSSDRGKEYRQDTVYIANPQDARKMSKGWTPWTRRKTFSRTRK